MKKLVLLSILVCFSFAGMAQYFKISFDPVFKDANGNDLSLALAGGLNYPQFSNIDLNNDGKQDLFVYDRAGDKVLTFIARTTNGNIKYEYSPEYEEFFPKGHEFMRLKDFNGDGTYTDLLTDLKDLKLDFDQIKFNYQFIEPMTIEEKSLTQIKSKSSVQIDAEVLNNIVAKVKSIRNALIG